MQNAKRTMAVRDLMDPTAALYGIYFIIGTSKVSLMCGGWEPRGNCHGTLNKICRPFIAEKIIRNYCLKFETF